MKRLVWASNFQANRLIALRLDLSRIACMLMCKQKAFMGCGSKRKKKNNAQHRLNEQKSTRWWRRRRNCIETRGWYSVYDVASIGMNCTFCTSLYFFLSPFFSSSASSHYEHKLRFCVSFFDFFSWRQHTLSFAPAAVANEKRSSERQKKKKFCWCSLTFSLFVSLMNFTRTHAWFVIQST